MHEASGEPSNTNEIEASFAREDGDPNAAISERKSSIKIIEWEHIPQTLVETDFNLSETARRLGMHRRPLTRTLEKRQRVNLADIAIPQCESGASGCKELLRPMRFNRFGKPLQGMNIGGATHADAATRRQRPNGAPFGFHTRLQAIMDF